jgi:hypothetical protein
MQRILKVYGSKYYSVLYKGLEQRVLELILLRYLLKMVLPLCATLRFGG